MNELEKKISKGIHELIIRAVTSVPKEISHVLADLKAKEQNNPIANSQLEIMLQNIAYGTAHQIPLCQDTGMPTFFIQLGSKFPLITDFSSLIRANLKELTEKAMLRPNTVDPFTDRNALDNSGPSIPIIYPEIVPDSSHAILSFLPKGGGAENMSRLFMLSPSTGLQEIIPRVCDALKDAGGNPCPPVILGLGIGGDATKSMYLAKKALLRPQNTKNSRPEIAKLEEDLLNAINQLNIGIMGLGGNSNCLDVRIEYTMRHPASFPVGMVVQCYCHRTLSMQITSDGAISFGHLNRDFQFIAEGK